MFIAVAVLLCVSLLVREMRLHRERAHLQRDLEELRLLQQGVKDGARRLAEDVFVLQNLLLERNLVTEPELLRARHRLIEQPRRKAEERDAMVKFLGVDNVAFLLEESRHNVH